MLTWKPKKGTLQKKVRPKSDIFSVTHNQRWFHCMFCNPRRRLIRSIEMPTPCNLSITISLSVVKSHITMFVTAHQPLPVGSVYQPAQVLTQVALVYPMYTQQQSLCLIKSLTYSINFILFCFVYQKNKPSRPLKKTRTSLVVRECLIFSCSIMIIGFFEGTILYGFPKQSRLTFFFPLQMTFRWICPSLVRIRFSHYSRRTFCGRVKMRCVFLIGYLVLALFDEQTHIFGECVLQK